MSTIPAEPDLLVVGRGCYSNQCVLKAWADEREFRIVPAAVPVTGIVLMNLLFIVVFGGFYWWVESKPAVWWGGLSVIAIGVMTCLFYTAFVLWEYHHENALGPLLIYDKATGRLELPRERPTATSGRGFIGMLLAPTLARRRLCTRGFSPPDRGRRW